MSGKLALLLVNMTLCVGTVYSHSLGLGSALYDGVLCLHINVYG